MTMFTIHYHVLFIIIISCSRSFAERNFTKRCGDCWCITNSTGNSTCPAFVDGYDDTIPAIYKTFLLVDRNQSAPKLRSADNSTNCFPFSLLVSKLPNIPQSTWDVCVPPPLADDPNAVCAFVYNEAEPVTNLSTCINRKYELKTFSSNEAAVSAGAVITHTRACGVCSTAQDLYVSSKNTNDIQSKSCGTRYYIDLITKDKVVSFSNLISCMSAIGYSSECSKLWAHAVAVTTQVCATPCQENAPYNEPDPPCKVSSCIECKDTNVETEFDLYAGRTNQRSGLTANIAYPCSSFSNVIQEPCDGKVTDYSSLPIYSPTSAPKTSGDNVMYMCGLSSVLSTIMMMWFLLRN